MARIRTVKPEFWASEQVMELSPLARLAFIGLWNFCDDAGVHTASPKRLKAEVFPSDEITIDCVSDLVDEMAHQGLVGEFESDGERFWYVTGWRKHQKIEKPTYRHPTPPESAAPRRIFAVSSVKDRREVADTLPSDDRADVECSPPEGNGMESNGTESKDQSQSSHCSDSPSAAQKEPFVEAVDDAKTRAKETVERLAKVTNDAITAYNASQLVKGNGGLLPMVSTKVGRDVRQREVNRCIKIAREICAENYESTSVVPEFWADYFAVCFSDDFKSGRIGGGKGHENWSPDFEYLTRKNVMLAVYTRANGEDVSGGCQ